MEYTALRVTSTPPSANDALGVSSMPLAARYEGPSAADLVRIPQVIRARKQWILYLLKARFNAKTGKIELNKIPIDPQTLRKAKTTDPTTWGTFEQCVMALRVALEEWEQDYPGAYRGGGIGFVFTSDDPFVGIDIDHCVDPDTGIIADWALAMYASLNSYTEITPSRTGLHIIAQGTLPPRGRRKKGVEMYDSARFFTVTGWHVSGTPTTIEARHDALSALHADIFGTSHATEAPVLASPAASLPLYTDAAVLEKARTARNSAKFTRLWSGDWTGYPSQSEADFALCILLTFWTQDLAQLDRLFRQSGLMRAKWDAQRGAQTYGARMITEALTRQTEHYHSDAPSSPRQPPPQECCIAAEQDATPDVRNTTPCSADLGHASKGYGDRAAALLRDPASVPALLRALGLPDDVQDGSFVDCPCREHAHDNQSPSPMGIWREPTGGRKDYGIWCVKAQQFYTLNELFHFQQGGHELSLRAEIDANGTRREHRRHFLLWGLRLLERAGLLVIPKAWGAPTLPQTAPNDSRTLWGVILNLKSYRNATETGSKAPLPLSYRFLRDWSAAVRHWSHERLQRAFVWIVSRGFLRDAGTYGSGIQKVLLWCIGDRALRRARRAASIEPTIDKSVASVAATPVPEPDETACDQADGPVCPDCGRTEYWIKGVCHYCIALAGKARQILRKRLYGSPPILEVT